MHLVFVYGTLKRGHGNNHLLKDSDFIGVAITVTPFRLVDGGVPFACRNGNPAHPIRGELYRVTLDILRRLDRLEGHPRLYQRTMTGTILENSLGLDAFIYTVDDRRFGDMDPAPVVDGCYEWMPVLER